MKTQPGFTLIELMTTLAVLAVLLGIAVPSFQSLVRENRSTSLTNDLVAGLQVSRSEALKRRSDITLCRRNLAGDDCADAGSDWSDGWLIRDVNSVLMLWDAAAGTPQVTGPSNAIIFASTGRTNGAATFSIQLAGCSCDGRRVVNANAIGRVTSFREACQ